MSLQLFFQIRNTATHKFASCDCTLIVAMVTLKELYFPKQSIQESLFYFWIMRLYLYVTALTMKIFFETNQISETPPNLQSMDKQRFSKYNYDFLFLTRMYYIFIHKDHWWHLVYCIGIKVLIAWFCVTMTKIGKFQQNR